MNREDKRALLKKSKKHYTKKLKKVRNKILYGDTDITRIFNKLTKILKGHPMNILTSIILKARKI